MITVSNEYKEIMNRPIRNRSYISVGIGVVNQDAQQNGVTIGDFAYWSKGNVFDTNTTYIEYATLEENYMRTDGTMYFMPPSGEDVQLKPNGITTENILSPIRIDFSAVYDIKGLTIDFGSAYPTEFIVQTENVTREYVNEDSHFETYDILGETRYIIITPVSMIGNNQRFRIQNILMGVGLVYTNSDTQSCTLKEYTSSISEELPSEDFSYTFFDTEGRFDVDSDSSFVNYLETMQKVSISFGIEKDNGNIEWHQIATTYLKSWENSKNTASIVATDRLAQMEDEYTLGNKIHERTAYAEAKSILTDAGLESDEYVIDEYLKDITLTNPMPVGTHKECLQILANACRCIIRQDEYGRVVIKANFASVLGPSDMVVESNGETEWSNLGNILYGTYVEYADMTEDFMRTDGTMYFLPEDTQYLDTGYVSAEISDPNGLFENNPTISIKLPAAYSYHEINVEFGGNPPLEMLVHTYYGGELIETVKYENLQSKNVLAYEFTNFDMIVFEFTKTMLYNRILVNKISFGDFTDYVLTRMHMMNEPVGYKEKRVKDVRVKIFTYTENEDGEPEEIEDNVFVTRRINEVGNNRTLQNPLIGNAEQAELLAEWIGNHYSNNVSYNVDYRGEPKINAADIISMETRNESTIPVEITGHELSFNGAFSGKLELRRAMKMV